MSVLLNHSTGTLRVSLKGIKVIHTSKKLFCNVVSICNLVQEFNGLVSIKGPAQVGPFTFYTNR